MTDLDILAKFNDEEEPEVWKEDECEPRTRKQRTNVATATASELKEWNKKLRQAELPDADDDPDLITGAPDLGRMAATPEELDAVDFGDIYNEEVSEKMGFAHSRRSYHDRVSNIVFNARMERARKTVQPTVNTCGYCGNEFAARKGTKYCSSNCRKRAYESKSADVV